MPSVLHPAIDPLDIALAVPANESPLERQARLSAESEAKRISDMIDEELQRQERAEKKGPRSVKILLLGQSESGKSTTLKNFQLMNSPKAFRAERASWRAVIHLNIVRSIRMILDVMAEAQATQTAAGYGPPSSMLRPSSSRDNPSRPSDPDQPLLTAEHLKLKMRLSPLLQVEQTLVRKLTPPGSAEFEATHLASVTSGYVERARSKEVAVNSQFAWKNMFSRFLPESRESFDSSRDGIDWDDPDDPGRIIYACGEDMIRLWNDDTIRKLLKMHNLRLEDRSGFFLDSLERITAPHYVPADDDILRARLKTLGITEYRFTIKDGSLGGSTREWKIFDVGGHRSLEDSVLLWKSIVSNPLLSKTSLVLLLNKIDIFKTKLEAGIRLAKYIVSYGNRPNDYETTSTYLRRKFAQIHQDRSPEPRPFYCHFTNVIDTKSTRLILADVQDTSTRYSDKLEDLDDVMRTVSVDNTVQSNAQSITQIGTPSSGNIPVQMLGKRKSLTREATLITDAVGPTKLRRTSNTNSQRTNRSTGLSDTVVLSTEASPHRSHYVPAALVGSSAPTPAATSEFQPVIIAYSHALRGYVDPLVWGAQWEISRFVSAGVGYDKFPIHNLVELRDLRTNAKSAPEVARMVATECGLKSASAKELRDSPFASVFAKENSVKHPWDELDKEAKILSQAVHGGLGCNESELFLLDDPWYGGRVHFTGKLVFVADTAGNSSYQVRLDRPVLGPSCEFSRRFGSYQFIRIRIPKDILNQSDKKGWGGGNLLEYFRRPFVVSSRVFRAFYSKEHNVFLVQTNECWDGTRIVEAKPTSRPPHDQTLSFLEFLKFHNNMELNRHQTMVKWAARFALGLSNSVPGARVRPSEIAFEDDIICAAWDGNGKAPNEQIMTDGCGLISTDILQLIADRLGLSSVPTAIQMRVCGSKGILLAHPHPQRPSLASSPRVWLRPSQVKIKHSTTNQLPANLDPALCTIDVLRPSRLTSPVRLSTETIINLAENGVPTDVFINLMKATLKAKVHSLTNWEGSLGLFKLWMNVARAGNVFMARLAREAAGAARAKGFVFEDFVGEETNDEDGLNHLDEAIEDHSTAWWDDPISGCPSSLEETVMVLLDAGFNPKTCPVLAAKLKEVVKRVITTMVRKYQIEVSQSLSAVIVPDPCNVLRPGEIHVKSSQRNLVDQDGKRTDIILGDVLVTRHPCKVPTDVQKVQAVYHEKLRNYVDVIVVSTKDHIYGNKLLNRHLASCTGGGDYDGDMMEVFWKRELVSAFVNADPKFLQEPPGVQFCLSKNTETVAQYLAHTPLNGPKEKIICELQAYLLGSLQDSAMVGIYSTWWENSIYASGYCHPTTIFLAYMFCAILDGSKTGVRVLPGAYEKHKRTYAHRPPVWKETEEERERHIRAETNEPNLRRETERLGVFIMDEIFEQAQVECRGHLAHVDEVLNPTVVLLDADLVAPFEEMEIRAQKLLKLRGDNGMLQELQEIQKHVEKVYSNWRRSRHVDEGRSGSGGSGVSGGKSKVGFTGLPIEKRQDRLRELSQQFHGGPSPSSELLYFDEVSLRRVRASYAYIFDHRSSPYKWSRFPWDVSMRTLCEIKANALGPSKTLTEDFYARMSINKAFLREAQ
ncbi:uncharacterized protein FIBRA_02822 [Fibroporia radiculosa]|uniref:RDRP core domain-containing protein n=1 Tax=Fibroporia radiculosa TaxID=599839 RepID=J4GN51_9APHY|nr:uncharacterized protein FIBRA_02822 [Fibroporia radiculosa]CCM00780.1 predicted protein [Fibroporia radiculosa]